MHQLTGLEGGAQILKRLQEAMTATDDVDLSDSAVGLLKRAQADPAACTETALVVSLEAPGQENAEFLLDNYREYTEVNRPTQVDAQSLNRVRDHLPESDLVQVFETYPALAAAFLKRLPLQQVGTVATTSRCDFEEVPNDTLIEDKVSAMTGPARFWDGLLEKGANEKFVAAFVVPVLATPIQLACDDDMEAAAPDVGATAVTRTTLRLGKEYEQLAGPPLDSAQHDSGTEGTGADSVRLPFSRLLDAVVKHADQTRDSSVFESDVLQVVVQYKWESYCKAAFMLLFGAYLIFIVVYVLTALVFASWAASASTAHNIAAWSMWGYSAVYSLLMVKREAHQIANEATLRAYFDFWNGIDIGGAMLVLASLALMAAATRTEAIDANLVRCFNAVAGLLGGIKVLAFLRGLDLYSFLISMLYAIIIDMANFFVVLGVIIATFAYCFYVLLQESPLGYPVAEGTGPSSNSSLSALELSTMSFVNVVDMVLGAFDIETFYTAPYWLLAVAMFILFMVLVQIVMLNALIAIMGDTFEKEQQNKSASSLLNRAKLILEIESFMHYDPEPLLTERRWLRPLRVLLSMRITYRKDVLVEYLHVLKPQESSEQGDEWQGRMRIMTKKFGDMQKQLKRAESSRRKLEGTVKEQAAEQAKAMKKQAAQAEEQAKAMKEQAAAMESRLEAQNKAQVDGLQATLQAILAASQMTDAQRTAAAKTSDESEPEPEPEPEPGADLVE
jgi:hypothetical protein